MSDPKHCKHGSHDQDGKKLLCAHCYDPVEGHIKTMRRLNTEAPDPRQAILDDLRARLSIVSKRLAAGIKPTDSQCRWMYQEISDMTEALERSMEVPK